MFVIYDKENREIKSAGYFTEESVTNEIKDGTAAGIIKTDLPGGALKNYVFVPDGEMAADQKFPVGKLERKPHEQWDLLAEKQAADRENSGYRFHHLDLSEVSRIDVYMIVTSVFRKIEAEQKDFQVKLEYAGESIDLALKFFRKVSAPIEFMFEFGSCTYPLRYTQIQFCLTGQENFLRKSTEDQLGSIGPNVWTSGIVKEQTFRLAIASLNKMIESYRIAYLDPFERHIGPADVLHAALVITLHDGIRCSFSSGLNLFAMGYVDRNTPPDASDRFQILLNDNKPDFFSVAIFEVKKAYLYGQNRETIIWAATVVNELIREVLLSKLPQDSVEYRKIKNSDKKVSGSDKRTIYFKKATGSTLKEHLEKLINRFNPTNNFLVMRDENDRIWAELPERIEELLELRNQLLHRRRTSFKMDASTAYRICMNFINAIVHGYPGADDVRLMW